LPSIAAPAGCLKLLFVKHALGFPRAAGHDIGCYELLRAFQQLGHRVGLATIVPPSAAALEGVHLDFATPLTGPGAIVLSGNGHRPPTFLQRRFARYWGADSCATARVGHAARTFGADIVIGMGLDVLPYLVPVDQAARVWYAGDEWVSHHLSLVRPLQPATWSEIVPAIVKGLYERAHASIVDRVWVVAEQEVRPMRRYGAMKEVDVVTFGVDVDYYRPVDAEEIRHSAIFWGRLDFGPNVQALEWLCREVWPLVRRGVPDATFTIMGFKPGPEVRALVADGVQIAGDVADIRPEAARHAVVLLPFWSGGGIKNKLLEALAMGKAVLCTPLACRGLRGQAPLRIAGTPQEWADALCELWDSDDERRRLAADARAWIVDHHTWRAAALDALRPLMRETAP
jgi:glycosyltransferase involved in cell wall biosynthesis